MTIPSNAPSGQWKVQWFMFEDKAGNHGDASGLSNQPAFSVANDNGDNVPPTIVDWSFSPATVGPGEQVTFNFELADQGTGIARAEIAWRNPSGSPLSHSALSGTAESSDHKTEWTFTVTIPSNAPSGQWKIQWFMFEDHAGNHGDASELNNEPAFVVDNPDGDDNPPTIVDWSYSPAVVSPGDSVTFQFTLADEGTGIADAEIAWRNPNGSPLSHGALSGTTSHSEDKTEWTFEITLPGDAPQGQWKIQWFMFEDNAANFGDASELNNKPVFTVQ